MVDSPGVVDGVDALVTRQPDLAIVALGADCLPLALIGADGQTVAVAHCGWRGLAGRRDRGGCRWPCVIRNDGTAGRSWARPSAERCYPVPAERARELVARTSAAVAGAALVACADGQPGIDVRAGARARLVELGVAAAPCRTSAAAPSRIRGCSRSDATA